MKAVHKKLEKTNLDKQLIKPATKINAAANLNEFELGWQAALTELNAFLSTFQKSFSN